jgi:hypothetical protein
MWQTTVLLDFLIMIRISLISINPLNAELNPIRHLLALVGARHIVHVSRIRVNVHTKNVPFIASPSKTALSHGKPESAGTFRDIYDVQKQSKEPASHICIHSCTLSLNIHLWGQVE